MIHRALYNLWRSDNAIPDPGAGNTITVSHQFATVPVVTAGAEPRTLRQPTKAGHYCLIYLQDDGGNLTLTVTGGFDQGGSTAIVFDTVGDWVQFVSVDEDGSFYWRVLNNEGSDYSEDIGTFGEVRATNVNATTGNITEVVATNVNATNVNPTLLAAVNVIATNVNASGEVLATNVNATTGNITDVVATNVNATTANLTDCIAAGNVNGTTGTITEVVATNVNATNVNPTLLAATNVTATNVNATGEVLATNVNATTVTATTLVGTTGLNTNGIDVTVNTVGFFQQTAAGQQTVNASANNDVDEMLAQLNGAIAALKTLGLFTN